jgi:DNA-binding transcriptional LysR family regulator
LHRSDFEEHVQLVLSDAFGAGGPSYGIVSTRVWRFVDLARRLDFLLSGFGWCKMPPYIVDAHVKAGRLVELEVHDESIAPRNTLPVYAAHAQSQPLGLGGRWLLNDLRQRLANA